MTSLHLDKEVLVNITSLRNVIREHLTNLADRFQFYFPAEEDPRKGNGWIRNPFIPLQDDLTGTTLRSTAKYRLQ